MELASDALMANAVFGSLVICGLGALFAVPVGVLSGVYVAEFKGTRFAFLARFAADTLNGVPSIVVGVFIYTIAVMNGDSAREIRRCNEIGDTSAIDNHGGTLVHKRAIENMKIVADVVLAALPDIERRLAARVP